MSSEEPTTLPATLVRRETYAPWWGRLLKPLEALISFLPSHRATKKGRNTAKQVRVVIMAVGLATMIFGGTLPLIIIGAVLMASALILPLSEVRKRSWLGNLRRKRTRAERIARSDGSLVHDGKRLILREADNKLRRVLIDRGEHQLKLRRRGDTPCLGVVPESGRKAESIWICSPEHGSVPEEAEEISEDTVDIWVKVTPNDWETIYDLLNK